MKLEIPVVSEASPLAKDNNLQGLDVYTENLEDFEKGHSHYQNPWVDSSSSLFTLLSDKATKKEALRINFNSSLIIANEESNIHGFENDKNFFHFLANSENSGDYEHRTYYGYDCLVGYASKYTKRGYVCPSMIVEIKDGKRVDTGQRLLRLLRTRCVSPEIHGIIYDTLNNTVFIVKGTFLASMHKKLRYTICHLPFKYDEAMKQ